jgi:hypothetical protein
MGRARLEAVPFPKLIVKSLLVATTVPDRDRTVGTQIDADLRESKAFLMKNSAGYRDASR